MDGIEDSLRLKDAVQETPFVRFVEDANEKWGGILALFQQRYVLSSENVALWLFNELSICYFRKYMVDDSNDGDALSLLRMMETRSVDLQETIVDKTLRFQLAYAMRSFVSWSMDCVHYYYLDAFTFPHRKIANDAYVKQHILERKESFRGAISASLVSPMSKPEPSLNDILTWFSSARSICSVGKYGETSIAQSPRESRRVGKR